MAVLRQWWCGSGGLWGGGQISFINKERGDRRRDERREEIEEQMRLWEEIEEEGEEWEERGERRDERKWNGGGEREAKLGFYVQKLGYYYVLEAEMKEDRFLFFF